MKKKFLSKVISSLLILSSTSAYGINYFDDDKIEYWPDGKKN